MGNILDKIIGEARKYYTDIRDPSHDFSHVLRVYNLAKYLQQREGGDKLIIGGSAYLHDFHQVLSQNGVPCSGRESLKEIGVVLDRVYFPIEKREMVLHCVEVHDQYGFSKEGNKAKTIEAKIVQDADNLDAMGAIGIGRTFSFGGFHNVPMYTDCLEFNGVYDPQQLNESTIQHCYAKLLKLRENMNTPTGRKLADKRHDVIEDFVNKFLDELRLK